MKKAGIIVGVILIILAIGVFVIVDKAKNPETKTSTPKTEITVSEEEKREEKTPIQQEKEEPKVIVEEKIVEVEKEVEVEVKVSEISEINESNLENPIRKEEIVILSKKRILLLDENPNENHSKNLAYNFILMTGDNKEISLFVTGVVYNGFSVGEKLKVEYDVYSNSKGIEFPIIHRATKIE